MKKFLKFGAVLTALVLGLACFVGCGEEDDGGSSNNGGNVSNNGGNTNNGGNSNEEEKPKVTVVAKYQDKDLYPYYYIFYSDMTYKVEEQARSTEEGEYSGSPTTAGRVAMIPAKKWNYQTGSLLPTNADTYVIIIDTDDNNKLYFKAGYGDDTYVLK